MYLRWAIQSNNKSIIEKIPITEDLLYGLIKELPNTKGLMDISKDVDMPPDMILNWARFTDSCETLTYLLGRNTTTLGPVDLDNFRKRIPKDTYGTNPKYTYWSDRLTYPDQIPSLQNAINYFDSQILEHYLRKRLQKYL